MFVCIYFVLPRIRWIKIWKKNNTRWTTTKAHAKNTNTVTRVDRQCRALSADHRLTGPLKRQAPDLVDCRNTVVTVPPQSSSMFRTRFWCVGHPLNSVYTTITYPNSGRINQYFLVLFFFYSRSEILLFFLPDMPKYLYKKY